MNRTRLHWLSNAWAFVAWASGCTTLGWCLAQAIKEWTL